MVRRQRREVAALAAVLVAAPGPTGAATPAAAAPEAVRVTGGFATATADRWSWVRFDLHNPEEASRLARTVLRFASGGTRVREVVVPALGHAHHCEYVYAGGPERLAEASAELGSERASWSPPDAIPPARLVVIVTADDGRSSPVRGLLSRQAEVGVTNVRPSSLPDRWLAWRGVAAAVVWADELPGRATAEGSALEGYVRAGGTVLVYGGARPGDLFEGWADGAAGAGRGRLYRMGSGRFVPPEIEPPPGAPPAAPMLVRGVAAPPLGWLLHRVAWYLPLCVLALSLLARRPGRGLLAAACIGLAVAGAPAAPSGPAEVRRATWEDGAGYTWTELQLLPARSGRLQVPVRTGDETSVVALDPDAELALALGPGGFSVDARWGEPVRLLVEGIARAD